MTVQIGRTTKTDKDFQVLTAKLSSGAGIRDDNNIAYELQTYIINFKSLCTGI